MVGTLRYEHMHAGGFTLLRTTQSVHKTPPSIAHDDLTRRSVRLILLPTVRPQPRRAHSLVGAPSFTGIFSSELETGYYIGVGKNSHPICPVGKSGMGSLRVSVSKDCGRDINKVCCMTDVN